MSEPLISMHDRFLGCLLGSALGDALGKLTEFMDYDEILHYFGPQGITEPPGQALYTDDTQLAMATSRALIRDGAGAINDLMHGITNEYLAWHKDQEAHPLLRRAPGVGVIDAVDRFRRGASYTAAADGGANESIVATRAVPIALRYHGDLPRIVMAASEISRFTHGHPGAVSGGAAGALLVEFALSGTPLNEWPRSAQLKLNRYCPDETGDTVASIRAAERTLDWPMDEALDQQFRARPGYGGGWTGEEAVGIAMWCFLRTPDDYVTTVRQAANLWGNSDTDAVAAMAGAFSGARNGIGALPPEWVARLEDGDEIRSLAEQLHEIRAAELSKGP